MAFGGCGIKKTYKMSWKCPECNFKNPDSILRCICGYEPPSEEIEKEGIMLCPKCNFTTFDHADVCKKCGYDLKAFKESKGIKTSKPAIKKEVPPKPQEKEIRPEAITESPQHAEANDQPLPFKFTGDGTEYFKIWIANIFLTIITLGIYSAWAKVRRQRYFYGNTSVGDSSFEYLANPMAILKGRIIAFVFFAGYSGIANLFPLAKLPLSLIFAAMLPWLIMKSLIFRSRNTAFRNIRFNFNGRYGDVASVYLFLPILIPITLGIAYPYIIYRQKDMIVTKSAFGTTSFQFNAKSGDFYKIFLIVPLLLIGGAFLIFMLYKTALPAIFLTVIPIYLFFFAYINCQLSNLVYNNITLEGHSLKSDMSVKDIFMLYLTNLIGIMLTLGLFIPWANIRLARYRAEHLQLIPSGSFDSFVAAQMAQVSSTGEEVGEMFDLDIGI